MRLVLPLLAAAALAIAGAAGCSATPGLVTARAAGPRVAGAGPSRPGSAASSPVTSPSPATSPSPVRSAPARPEPRPRPAPRVVVSSVRAADGAVIMLAVFRGPVTYALHNGSQDPGTVAADKGVTAGPVITPAERHRLLAAFNGGFKLSAGAGGYEQEGKVISPLVPGDASFIIDTDGRARIARWGHGAPARGEKIWSVRQNLGPLVEEGRPVPAAADWWDWGATVGGSMVARSAIGMTASGTIIYAASMSALPADLAVALAARGARIAMELDINPEWVQLDVAAWPGGPLRMAVPGQWRPADQYLTGWTRDFVTVQGA